MHVSRHEGKLKVFLGMVAGVGKTCAMLESARSLKSEGRDVVIGLVETHGRKKTEALLPGFEILPRKKLLHAGTEILEMDLDAILARGPELVLVDELAHTNAPGSRHPKRFMDVEEILRAGIDVYTTINVQHFESRVDLVRNLSGIEIKESVPDSLLDRADQIELIDLPPDELLARLEKGEIYPQEKIERSLQGFFKRGTLTALREISLRLTAERVDHEVIRAVRNRDLPQDTHTRDRLLVAIGPSPSATELLRWTRNKAFNLNAPWIAAYIDTGVSLSSEDRRLLDENIELARHLGAELVTVSSPNIAQAILALTRERQVTEIVMGKPRMSFVHQLLAPESPVDTIYKEKGSVTISIVTTDKIKVPTIWQLLRRRVRSKPAEYLFSFGNVAVTTVLLLLLLPIIGYRGVGLVFLFAVLCQSLVTGRGPIYLAALLGAISWNFFFMPARFTFTVVAREDQIHLALFVAMASVLGSLTNKVRVREQAYREREARATFLFEVSKVFSEQNELAGILEKLKEVVAAQLGFDVAYYVRVSSSEAGFSLRSEGRSALTSREMGVAHWTLTNLRRAGRDTETLPESEGIYFPLVSGSEVFGSIGFFPHTKDRIDFTKKSIFEAVTRQLSLFLEKQHYLSLITATRALEESAKLQKSLFSSISHEFKTPLTALLGGLQAISDSKAIADDASLTSIAKDVSSSGARLTHVVDALLDMSRLESGTLVAKSEWVSLEEAVGLVLGRLETRLTEHDVLVAGVSELPLIKADFVLVADVIRNVISNSLQYSDPKGKIEIHGYQNPTHVIMELSDEGRGVGEDFGAKIFHRFSRENPNVPGGLGLGLSICEGLMDAMQASISAVNRKDGISGFLVTLSFPKTSEGQS
ncbi:MAG: sensor histidine kinase KdpD [Bdellovibrionota bacterium]